MLSELKSIFPNLDIKLGGSTSIDVTLKGIDKSFGVKQMLKFLNNKMKVKLSLKDLLFFGDNFHIDGNDYAVKKMGVDCIEVNSSKHTLKEIKKLL
jgi:hydroxymethylpyrimidine pyrophosphatase-like HAD family hydrolase